MASLLKKTALEPLGVDGPKNNSRPLRIALLGGARSGKTSLISKLSLGGFRDTYYPTTQTQPILLEYIPTSSLARSVLDENEIKTTLTLISKEFSHVEPSPVIYEALSKAPRSRKQTNESTTEKVINTSNEFYNSYHYKSEVKDPSKYALPHYSPILVELIDTPAFNPDQVVPFLEASLYVKLDKNILKNLANEPRRPVSTNPLLVASGASELNGAVDAYLFVYSAIPSYNPPSYDEALNADASPSNAPDKEEFGVSSSGKVHTLTLARDKGDTTFQLLSVMKAALDEAWKEYNTYRARWEEGKESDMLNLKTAFKNLWNETTLAQIDAARQQRREDIVKFELINNSPDPADPNCPPPIWIVCTHSKSSLASQQLVQDGVRLSKFWKCGFISIDVTDDTVDEALALVIREILERIKLQKGKKK